MSKKILVTYSSRYGATAEIAHKIGDVLRQASLNVEVLPVKAVQNPASYRAVILGSGVYIGKWNQEAVAFLKANQISLAERPVWIFSSGPTGEGDAVTLVKGQLIPTALQPVADRIRPRDLAVFHGHINPVKVNFLARWMIKNMVKAPFGDYRDWDMIARWAGGIAAALREPDLN